jgi:hypothetical protein
MGLVDRLSIDSALVAETTACCRSGSPVFTPATTHSRAVICPREKQPEVEIRTTLWLLIRSFG